MFIKIVFGDIQFTHSVKECLLFFFRYIKYRHNEFGCRSSFFRVYHIEKSFSRNKSLEQLEKSEYIFEVLSDLDDSVMKSYNLYFEVSQELYELYKNRFNFNITDYNGKNRLGLPVSGTFVIDRDEIIKAAYAKTDYKNRMEPEDIIKALKVIHGAENLGKNN